MKKSYELGQKQFDTLLGFFSTDREEAGEIYEEIRKGLFRFFEFKGCNDPDLLADDTINRVALKIDAFDPAKNVKPATYFYGFASNVLMEYRRIAGRSVSITENEYLLPTTESGSDSPDVESECLQKCLANLPADERELIVEYYCCERQDKLILRKQMSEKFKCSAAALYTKIFRIKGVLRGCMKNCLATL